MNTFITSILLTLTVSFTTLATPTKQPSKKQSATKLAHYEMGAYLTADRTKLRLNVDKQVGGQVFITLVDQEGTTYFERQMRPLERTARLSIDLTDLMDGYYVLKVSNGLEMEVREVKITTAKPTTLVRSVTVL